MSCRFREVFTSESTGKQIVVCNNEEWCGWLCEGEDNCPMEKNYVK